MKGGDVFHSGRGNFLIELAEVGGAPVGIRRCWACYCSSVDVAGWGRVGWNILQGMLLAAMPQPGSCSLPRRRSTRWRTAGAPSCFEVRAG